MINEQEKIILEQFFKLKKEKKWSIRQAAKKLDIDFSSLCKIEKKKREPTKNTLQKMAYVVLSCPRQNG